MNAACRGSVYIGIGLCRRIIDLLGHTQRVVLLLVCTMVLEEGGSYSDSQEHIHGGRQSLDFNRESAF